MVVWQRISWDADWALNEVENRKRSFQCQPQETGLQSRPDPIESGSDGSGDPSCDKLRPSSGTRFNQRFEFNHNTTDHPKHCYQNDTPIPCIEKKQFVVAAAIASRASVHRLSDERR